MTDLQLLGASAGLTFVMVMVASTLKGRPWAPGGTAYAFGNRGEPREITPMAARADRAASNMLENMVLFVPLLLAAHLAVGDTARVRLGAQIFFWARVAYFPLYVLGVAYVRSFVWMGSLVGLALLGLALL